MGEPIFLHLSYGTMREAIATAEISKPIYSPSRIEVDIQSSGNTYQPGEGA